MDGESIQSIRESYDRIADEYALRIFNELQHKPLDRDLLNRFAAEIAGRGQVCDMGCGPGHVARYLHDAGTIVFGLDLSEKMLEQARRLFLFQPSQIRRCLEDAGLGVEDIIERGPYAPEVEYQSRRAYIFARKPSSLAPP